MSVRPERIWCVMKKMIITIGRENGSGGREIGRQLAQRLDIPFYDKELLALAAQGSKIDAETMRRYDEKREHPLVDFMQTQATSFWHQYQTEPMHKRVAEAEFSAIRLLAEKGPCVLIGRCADYVLRNRTDVLRVFIRADDHIKVQRIIQRHGFEPDKALTYIRSTDKHRSAYYTAYTNWKWGDPNHFHLVLDSTPIGVDGAVEVICQYIQAIT